MGCFSSKPARPLQCYTYKEKPGLVDETTTDATVYQGGLTVRHGKRHGTDRHTLGVLLTQAVASAASWQANGYRATQYDIQMQPGYIFAASFAGVFGETAAAYFAKHAFAVGRVFVWDMFFVLVYLMCGVLLCSVQRLSI